MSGRYPGETTADAPGQLLASGRTADVYTLADDRVVRR